MHISDRGIEFIKDWEGFRGEVYRDVAGFETIGYGHKLRPGEQLTRISQEQGDTLLRADLGYVVRAIETTVPGPLAQCEFDALCSLAFNIGAPALLGSTLVRRLAQGDRPAAAEEFARWCHAGGRVVTGLVARRLAERAMFLGEGPTP